MGYRCKICDNETETETEMRRHLEVHSPKQLYTHAFEAVQDGE